MLIHPPPSLRPTWQSGAMFLGADAELSQHPTLPYPTYWRWRNSAFTEANDASVGNTRLIPNRLPLTAQTLKLSCRER
jgi:hypothetical protein